MALTRLRNCSGLALTWLPKDDKVHFHIKWLIYGYVNIEHIGLMFVENMPSFD